MRLVKLLASLFLFLYASQLHAIIDFSFIKHCTTQYSNDGALEVVANGNAGPFNFHWSTGANTSQAQVSSINNLSPGQYSVTVSTSNGCEFVLTTYIQVCGFGNPSFDISGDVTNSGSANDGKVIITISNNTAYKDYIYRWTNAAGQIVSTSKDLLNVPEGTYQLVVTNGCLERQKTFVIKGCTTFTTPLSLTLQETASKCFGSYFAANGNINLTVVAESKTFVYHWSGPNGFTASTEDLIGVPEGEYCVTVTDDCGRTSTKCKKLKCCNPNSLPSTWSKYNCYVWYDDLGIGHNHDGDIGVNLPTKPNDIDCDSKLTIKWDDGQVDVVTFNNATGLWEGISSRHVPESSGNIKYNVTVTNQCGCSRESFEFFGSDPGSFSGFNYWSIRDYFTRSDNKIENFEFYDQFVYALTGCFSCSGCGRSGEDNIIGDQDCTNPKGNHKQTDWFTYSDPNPLDENICRGGSINCVNNHDDPTLNPWTIIDGFDGTEIVDYNKVEQKNVNGQIVCVNPAWCVFPPGVIDNFPNDINMPVLVRHPIGKVIPNSTPPCTPTSPPYSGECPGGTIGPDPAGVSENCILPYICYSTGEIVRTEQEEVLICRCTIPAPEIGCYLAYTCPMYKGNSEYVYCNAFFIDFSTDCNKVSSNDVPKCLGYAKPGRERGPVSERIDQNTPLSVQVYPNPTTGHVQISVNPEFLVYSNNVDVYLYDLAGRQLFKKNIVMSANKPIGEISLANENIVPGAYYLKIAIPRHPVMTFLIMKIN